MAQGHRKKPPPAKARSKRKGNPQKKVGGAKSGGVAKQKGVGNVGKLTQNMDKAIRKQIERDIVSQAQHLHFKIVTDSVQKGKSRGKASKGTCK